MEKVILEAKIREELGKIGVKKIKTKGLVPAVCYKDGKNPLNLKINLKDFTKVLQTKAGENVLITLKVDDVKAHKERTVIIREIQKDPIKEGIIHVDFKEISLTEQIKVKVRVVTRNDAKEVVKEGGIIEHAIWELDVECLPTNIPEKIEVDISGMKIGDTVQIKNIQVPSGVKILNDPELVVLTAKPPAKEEVKVEEAEALAEPEVIEKGKKKEEEEAEAEEKPQATKKEDKKE